MNSFSHFLNPKRCSLCLAFTEHLQAVPLLIGKNFKKDKLQFSELASLIQIVLNRHSGLWSWCHTPMTFAGRIDISPSFLRCFCLARITQHFDDVRLYAFDRASKSSRLSLAFGSVGHVQWNLTGEEPQDSNWQKKFANSVDCRRVSKISAADLADWVDWKSNLNCCDDGRFCRNFINFLTSSVISIKM